MVPLSFPFILIFVSIDASSLTLDDYLTYQSSFDSLLFQIAKSYPVNDLTQNTFRLSLSNKTLELSWHHTLRHLLKHKIDLVLIYLPRINKCCVFRNWEIIKKTLTLLFCIGTRIHLNNCLWMMRTHIHWTVSSRSSYLSRWDTGLTIWYTCRCKGTCSSSSRYRHSHCREYARY